MRNGVRFLRVIDPILRLTKAPAPYMQDLSSGRVSKVNNITSGVSTARTFLMTLREIAATAIVAQRCRDGERKLDIHYIIVVVLL